jgi:hypothetical protein
MGPDAAGWWRNTLGAGGQRPSDETRRTLMISSKTLAAVAAAMVVLGSAVAMAKEKKSTTPVVHSPESIECSKQADAKGLHGKERKKFRAQCKKDLEKSKTDTTKKPDDKKS